MVLLLALVPVPILVGRLRHGSSLTLHARGFDIDAWRHEDGYAWTEVAEFAVTSNGDDDFVEFNVCRPTRARGRNQYDVRLPDTYGMSPHSLVVLLERWHARALADRPTSE